MLILLPPSESKRSGGSRHSRLELTGLRFPELLEQRRVTADALATLAREETPEAAARALGIPPTLLGEVATNAALFDSPVMPALDRYTGVLYDALDPGTLPAAARRHLGRTVAIHSAVFGPVGALDRIPEHRMSATARLPGIRLRRLWAAPVTSVLAKTPGPIIDLRSESYLALGPVARDDAAFVRVVTQGPDGARRAMNHFNKHAKGALVRAFALERPRIRSVDAFLLWARSAGFGAERGSGGEVLLVVE